MSAAPRPPPILSNDSVPTKFPREYPERSPRKEHQGDNKPTLGTLWSFSGELREKVLSMIPEEPLRIAGSWQGRPPFDSADYFLWKLVGRLKFDHETSDWPVDSFKPIVTDIAATIGIDDDDAWRIFCRAYTQRQEGTVSCMLLCAKANAADDIRLGDDSLWPIHRYRDPRRRLLLGIMFYILTDWKTKHFLPTRIAGELVGVDKNTASNWIKAMVKDELIDPLAAGTTKTSPKYTWRG